MKKILYILLVVVNRLSFCIVILTGLICTAYEFVGVPKIEKILKKLHIHLSFNSIIIIGCICTLLLIN